MLSEFKEIVCGAALFPVSTLSLAEYVLPLTMFLNDVFHNSFTNFGSANGMTNGSVIFGLRSIFFFVLVSFCSAILPN